MYRESRSRDQASTANVRDIKRTSRVIQSFGPSSRIEDHPRSDRTSLMDGRLGSEVPHLLVVLASRHTRLSVELQQLWFISARQSCISYMHVCGVTSRSTCSLLATLLVSSSRLCDSRGAYQLSSRTPLLSIPRCQRSLPAASTKATVSSLHHCSILSNLDLDLNLNLNLYSIEMDHTRALPRIR